MRRTYVYDREAGKMVEKTSLQTFEHFGVLPDIKDFETTDGVHIRGRAGLREYERRTGLEQCGDDYLHGTNDDGTMKGRIVQELPSARIDVIEAMKRHSS